MDEENSTLKNPWPADGDKLFAAGSDWRNNACLGFVRDKWDLYATGYKDAADIIVDRLVETGEGADLLVYPVAFLYRHYLELRLKELIIHGQELLDVSKDFRHIHRIDVLWSSCRDLLQQIYPGSPRTELDAVEACIAELCLIDRQSISFRYPATKDGNQTLPSVEHINLRHLRDVMSGIASLLDGASMGVSAYLDEKRSGEASVY